MELVVLAFDSTVVEFAAPVCRLADNLFESGVRGQDKMRPRRQPPQNQGKVRIKGLDIVSVAHAVSVRRVAHHAAVPALAGQFGKTAPLEVD